MNKTEIENELSSFPGSWNNLLKNEVDKEYYQKLVSFLSDEYQKEIIHPCPNQVFRALQLTDAKNVKCVIIGQDPYFNPGQANGLAFSVNDDVALPPSLLNIYKELRIEFGYPIIRKGSLDNWARQGVLLLNSTLTVKEGLANSHSKIGWYIFTDEIIKKIDSMDKPVVYLLWGGYAHQKEKLIKSKNARIIKTVHPSPLSANRGFFNSGCFKKVNEYLNDFGLSPIDWQIK
ncbi:MAG: uracil-DNA glycosylase [Bacilli bacterium]